MANGVLPHHEQQQNQLNELMGIVLAAEKAVEEMQRERHQLDEARKAYELESEALKKAKEEAERATAELKEERTKREEASVANHGVLTEGYKKLREELDKLITLAKTT